MALSVADWLRDLGLERYEPQFREHEIDMAILPSITSDDLREIGVTVIGHRRRLLDAIATLKAELGKASLNVVSNGGQSRRARAESERRQMTILFCDLVGSTRLSEELDPEDFRDVLIAYKDAVTGIVARFDGFVARYLGDGVLAYFGWPQAYEYDAERAVRAGLEMVESVATLGRVEGRELACRVGIATGPVIVGDLVGSSFSDNDQVVGRTPNLAARLQGVAAPGSVAIANETRGIVARQFELSDIGAHALKGLAGKTQVWRVDRVVEGSGTSEDWRPWRTAVVGRQAEMSRLEALWDQALDGSGRGVVITGEAGIGKSALIGELARKAAQSRARVMTYQCSPFHTNDTLYPVLNQLRYVARESEDATREPKPGRFERLFAAAGLDVPQTMQLLGPLLGLPVPDTPRADTLDARGRKEKTFQALIALFDRFIGPGGVLVLFEDLHWADPTTREFLDRLLARIDQMRALVLMTSRSDTAIEWGAAESIEVLELSRLTSARIDQIVAHAAGDTVLPKEVRALIAERSDGVPLFAEELTKSVVESGIRERNGQPAGETETFGYDIPMTLRDSLISRIDRLPESRLILQTAAAIGRDFSSDLLAAVLNEGRDPIRAGLAQLADSDLIVPNPSARGVFAFRHALLRDAAYETLLRNDRVRMHERIAEALSSQFADTAPLHVTASHWARCGRHVEAALGYAAAAETSMARYANEEAAAQFRSALTQLDLVTEVPEGVEMPDRAALLEDLGKVLTLRNDVDGATAALTRAISETPAERQLHRARLHRLVAKAQQRNRSASLAALDAAEEALGPITPDSSPDWRNEWIEVQLIRLFVHYWSGDGASMGPIADRLAPLITQAAPEQRAEFFDQLALRDLRTLRYVPAEQTVANIRRFLDAACETDDLALQASARFMLGFVLMHRGTLAEAQAEMDHALDLARRSGHRAIEVRCMTYMATTARRGGDVETTRALSEETLGVARSEGMPEYVAMASGNLAWVAWRQGDIPGALRNGVFSLGEFERSDIAFPFEWGAILPIIACHADAGTADADPALAQSLCARLVDPGQQRLPDELDAALTAARDAPAADRAAALTEVVQAARKAGFL